MMRRSGWGACLLVVLGLAATAPAWGQRSLSLDPGVRGAGMGGTVTAGLWSGDADTWANPALLGYRDGLRYTFGTTKLIPQFNNDIVYRTQQFSAGWSGVGVSASSLTLDYGDQEGTDPKGNPTGTFASTEHAAVYGLGLSVAEVVSALNAGGGESPPWLRYVDLAVGATLKHYDIDLAPVPAGQSETDAGDWGMTVRFSPIPEGSGGTFVDAVFGHAVLDYDDSFVTFPNEEPISTPRIHRNGFAVRVGMPMTNHTRESMPSWIAGGMGPLLALTAAGDFVSTTNGDREDGFDETHVGFEADLLGLFALRLGHVSDELDIVDGVTYGFGLGLPIREWAGVRYDFASVPLNSGDRQLRHAASVFVDPIALFQSPRGD